MLEADFQREYHLDLNAELWRRGMSWRRFEALTAALSPNALTPGVLRNLPASPGEVVAGLDAIAVPRSSATSAGEIK